MKTVSVELQPCLLNRSGVGTYIYELSKRLHNTSNLTFYGNVFNFLGRNCNEKIYQEFSYKIREQRIIPYSTYYKLQNTKFIPNYLLFPPTDVNLFFSYVVPNGVKGSVINTVYDMTYIRFPETMERKNFERIRDGMKRSIERTDRIITISEFSKKEIVELLQVPQEKVSVIYCAAPDRIPVPQFPAIAQKYGICKPYILFVGTIEPRKNLVNLLKAFDKLKSETGLSHQLILAGGTGWQNEEILKTAESLQYKNDVVFTGYVTAEEKAALYSNADLFVFPSFYEGFGIPPLEAMQYGCPVVCSNAASLPEAVGNAAELINPYSVENIVDGLYRVLTDKERKKILIKFGYKQINEFNWNRSSEQLVALINNME